MRKLTAGLFMSLDGVVESPNLWQFDSFDEELSGEMAAMITRVDTVLLGRVGYEQWAGYWPNPENNDDFGTFINAHSG
jgi:dihydrofolate reductase